MQITGPSHFPRLEQARSLALIGGSPLQSASQPLIQASGWVASIAQTPELNPTPILSPYKQKMTFQGGTGELIDVALFQNWSDRRATGQGLAGHHLPSRKSAT